MPVTNFSESTVSRNFQAANDLINALEEIANLLRGHFVAAITDEQQNRCFLHERLQYVQRILLNLNRRMLFLCDLTDEANDIGQDNDKRYAKYDSTAFFVGHRFLGSV